MLSSKRNLLIITAIIVFGVIARLLPHLPNFAPMGALALFAVAFYKRKYLAVILPAAAWWLSDLYLNNTRYATGEGFQWFTADQLFTIIALALIVGLGSLLFKKLNVAKVILGSLSASLVFFLVSNFGVWMQGILYPQTLVGLGECYTMALPFYKWTFLSDMIFTAVFFGLMYFVQSYRSKENLSAELS